MMLAVFLAIDILIHLLCSVLHSPLPSLYITASASPHDDNTKLVRHSKVCFVSAVDFNQLGFFLLANLFTGIVNFSLDTLNTGTGLSVMILVSYMGCLMAIFIVLFKLKVKIKL